ncbi:hypothetical protein SAMN05443636_1363 [Halobaculum gomorrense]|uniref:Uncharacterized protein n=1 Tax=Halobaculum gomorrense TaxID=43928 RepID=A0A1M5NXB7_9EURY|nr:hypothetical protein SAMN05443636_1363 [Halobaculum gomorrense]
MCDGPVSGPATGVPAITEGRREPAERGTE